MNRCGKPLSLLEDGKAKPVRKPVDLLAGADLSRFDKAKTQKEQYTAQRQHTTRQPPAA